MNTPNDKMMVLGALGPDDDDQDLRAVITVDLEDDEEAAPAQAVDEFADEFLLQAPRSRGQDGPPIQASSGFPGESG